MKHCVGIRRREGAEGSGELVTLRLEKDERQPTDENAGREVKKCGSKATAAAQAGSNRALTSEKHRERRPKEPDPRWDARPGRVKRNLSLRCLHTGKCDPQTGKLENKSYVSRYNASKQTLTHIIRNLGGKNPHVIKYLILETKHLF